MDSNYLFVATLADTILINRNLYRTEIIGMAEMLNKIMTPVVNRSRLHKCISSESFCMKNSYSICFHGGELHSLHSVLKIVPCNIYGLKHMSCF